MEAKTRQGFSRMRKACLRCATAKARCTVQDRAQGCERCQRLKKDCTFREDHGPRRHKYVTRVARLEGKVDGLLSLLDPSHQIDQRVGSPEIATPTPVSVNSHSGGSHDVDSTAVVCSCGNNRQLKPEVDDMDIDIVEQGLISLDKADELLHNFRTQKMPHFPFVVVDSNINATALRSKSPFRFLVIMAISLTETEMPLRKRIGLIIRKTISQKVLFNHERSLDFVQGLMLFICWYHLWLQPATTMDHPYMLISILSTCNSDMGLDRKPFKCSHKEDFPGLGNFPLANHLHSSIKIERSAEERRTFLGCFYLSISQSLDSWPQLALSHTKWVDECCQYLADNPEYPSDILLKTLIQCKTLTKRINDTFNYNEPFSFDFGSEGLLDMLVRNFEAEATKIREEFRTHSNIVPTTLEIDMDRMSAHLYEFSLYYLQSPKRTPGSHCGTYLWKLLVQSRHLMASWLNIPPEELRHTPMTAFTAFRYGLLVLSNINLLPNDPEWDRDIARREARVSELCQKFLDSISQLSHSTSATPPDHRDIWSIFRVGLRSMLLWYKKSEQFIDSQTTQDGFSLSEERGHSISDYLHICSWLVLRRHLQEALGILRHPSSVQMDGAPKPIHSPAPAPEHMHEIDWDSLEIQTILDDFSLFPFPATWDENLAISGPS